MRQQRIWFQFRVSLIKIFLISTSFIDLKYVSINVNDDNWIQAKFFWINKIILTYIMISLLKISYIICFYCSEIEYNNFKYIIFWFINFNMTIFHKFYNYWRNKFAKSLFKIKSSAHCKSILVFNHWLNYNCIISNVN